ncbi:MAG: DegV family protein [Chloroflexota bacterium]|nr:DegV family protein [Chloroflexota bacterium]
MSKIAIVTDSTAYLSEDLVAAYNITVLPLVVIWGEEILRDNIDIGPDEFYQRLSTAKTMPSTSQATIQAFADAYKQLDAQGYEILTIVISSALSGTLDSAIQAKKMVPDAKITLFDSQQTSLPLAYMVLSAARSAKHGAPMERCLEIVNTIREHTKLFFAVDSLEFLHRGGRIGGASRFLGTALNLKPILELVEGKIEAVERVRTRRRAHDRLIEILKTNVNGYEKVNMIGVISAAAAESAAYLLNTINKDFTPDEILLSNLSPVIGTHTGPGTVGVAYVAGVDQDLLNS